MTMRITGMSNTGLDIDALVTDSLKPYKTKIQTATQKQQIMKWKQDLHQEIMKKATTFYNKYLDPISATSLYSSKAYNQTKFESSSSAVTATGSSTANIANYTISGITVATKASGTISNADIVSGSKISINGKEFALRGANQTEIAANLKDDLSKSGVSVNARYSNLANGGAGGLIIENNNVGNTKLTIGFTQKVSSTAPTDLAVDTAGSYATTVKGSSLVAGNSIKIKGTSYTLTGANADEITTNLNNSLIADGGIVNATYDSTKGIMTLKASASGDASGNKFTASTINSGNETALTVDIDGKYSATSIDPFNAANQGIVINGQTFRLGYKADGTTLDLATLNTQMGSVGVSAAIDGSGKISLTSTNTGVASKFTAKISTFDNIDPTSLSGKVGVTDGKNLSATISDGTNSPYVISNGTLPNETKITGNQVVLDGTTFNFVSNAASVTITGSQDVSGLKNQLVSFVKDYNDLLGSINGKLWESYDKDYQPLTDDQKSSMSETQITQWETKAKTGLLRGDDDLETLAESMKSVMSTVMKSTGLDLDRIGITPVGDYKELNGTYTVDEEKLTSALQSNFNNIKDLFTKGSTDTSTSDQGIVTKLKSVINDNFIKFDSVFNKKAANTGIFALTSELSKQITDQKTLIKEMNSDLDDRQDALYSKYSKLESAMAEAEAQQNQMSSWFTS